MQKHIAFCLCVNKFVKKKTVSLSCPFCFLSIILSVCVFDTELVQDDSFLIFKYCSQRSLSFFYVHFRLLVYMFKKYKSFSKKNSTMLKSKIFWSKHSRSIITDRYLERMSVIIHKLLTRCMQC